MVLKHVENINLVIIEDLEVKLQVMMMLILELFCYSGLDGWMVGWLVGIWAVGELWIS